MTREEAIESMEYSKAQAEIALSKGVSQYWKQEINWTIEAIEMAIDALKNTADRPRGGWIVHDIVCRKEICLPYECSNCGFRYSRRFNFCSNCGSDNRERSE